MTITKIVEENPKRGLWPLAWIYGFLSLINGSQSLEIHTQAQFLLLLVCTAIIAPLWGMLIFSFWSFVVRWVGKLLKGSADFSAIRAAFAWSCVPLTINIALWLLGVAFYGKEAAQVTQPMGAPVAMLMLILIAKMVVMVWSLVIYINALAAVQGFSVARSILNIVLAWVAVGLAAALIFMGIALLTQGSMSAIHAAINLTFGMQL
jgi:hypothetical protein